MNVTQEGNLVTVELEDGTVVKHWYHVCPACTSADTWIVGPEDLENRSADRRRATVDIAVWNRDGGRTWVPGTTTNHVLRHNLET